MSLTKNIKATKSSSKTKQSSTSVKKGHSDENSYVSNRIPFGADLYVFCKHDSLHPGLVRLFQHVSKTGPTKLSIPVYSKSSWWESKWLKRALQKGDVHGLNSYSPAAHVLALRNFLKHLPRGPLLQGREFIKLADDIQILPQVQWTWAVPQCKETLQILRPVECTLLHHVVAMMHTLCYDPIKQTMNQTNLEEVTNLFGPVLLRKRLDETVTVETKPCPEAVILSRFLVQHYQTVFDGSLTKVLAPQVDHAEVVASAENATSDPLPEDDCKAPGQDLSVSASGTTVSDGTALDEMSESVKEDFTTGASEDGNVTDDDNADLPELKSDSSPPPQSQPPAGRRTPASPILEQQPPLQPVKTVSTKMTEGVPTKTAEVTKSEAAAPKMEEGTVKRRKGVAQRGGMISPDLKDESESLLPADDSLAGGDETVTGADSSATSRTGQPNSPSWLGSSNMILRS